MASRVLLSSKKSAHCIYYCLFYTVRDALMRYWRSIGSVHPSWLLAVNNNCCNKNNDHHNSYNVSISANWSIRYYRWFDTRYCTYLFIMFRVVPIWFGTLTISLWSRNKYTFTLLRLLPPWYNIYHLYRVQFVLYKHLQSLHTGYKNWKSFYF
jgi:hypothetical protein